jgi:hypothetical protein
LKIGRELVLSPLSPVTTSSRRSESDGLRRGFEESGSGENRSNNRTQHDVFCSRPVCGTERRHETPADSVEGLFDNPVDRQPSQLDKLARGARRLVAKARSVGSVNASVSLSCFEADRGGFWRGFLVGAAAGSGRGRVGRRRITLGRTEGEPSPEDRPATSFFLDPLFEESVMVGERSPASTITFEGFDPGSE